MSISVNWIIIGSGIGLSRLFDTRPLSEPITQLTITLREIWSKIQRFLFKEMYLKILSAKRPPFCLGLSMIKHNKRKGRTRSSSYKHIYLIVWVGHVIHMNWSWMTSSDGNIYRVHGPLWGESTGDRSFDVFFDLRLSKRLSKQSTRQWFETPSRPL